MSQQESAKTQAKEKILEALFEYAAACHVESISTANHLKILLSLTFNQALNLKIRC
jgi:hypothetical protein